MGGCTSSQPGTPRKLGPRMETPAPQGAPREGTKTRLPSATRAQDALQLRMLFGAAAFILRCKYFSLLRVFQKGLPAFLAESVRSDPGQLGVVTDTSQGPLGASREGSGGGMPSRWYGEVVTPSVRVCACAGCVLMCARVCACVCWCACSCVLVCAHVCARACARVHVGVPLMRK